MQKSTAFRFLVVLALIVGIMGTIGIVYAYLQANDDTYRVCVDQAGNLRLLHPDITGHFSDDCKQNEFMIELPSRQLVEMLENRLSELENRVSELEGLILWLPMDEGQGDVVWDRSGFGNDGVIIGATWATTDGGLPYLSFDGVDDYVDCGTDSSLDFTGIITLETWVKITKVNAWQRVISRDSNGNPRYLLNISSTNVANFYINDGAGHGLSLSGTTPVADGEWHHLAAVYDGARAQLYVDGVSEGSAGKVINSFSPTNTLKIGAYWTPPREFLKGGIALTRIYNRGLPLTIIQNHYNQEKHLFGP